MREFSDRAGAYADWVGTRNHRCNDNLFKKGIDNMIHDIFIFIVVMAAIFTLLAAFAVGLGILLAATVKQGFRTAAGAIEKFFGSGCKVSTEGHVVKVKQVAPLLEIATARGEFDHSFTWKKEKVKLLGLPIPFTGREAVCRHDYTAKAGFDLKTNSCSFEFVPVKRYGFLSSIFGPARYLAVVTIPEPIILSIETAHLNIEDRSGVFDFWNRLGEDDRNAISSEMFVATREHLKQAGCALFEISKCKLESGLRSILPSCVEKIEYNWISGDGKFEPMHSEKK